MPTAVYDLAIVVALTSDELKGIFDLTLKPVMPDGEVLAPATLPIELEGPGIVKPTFTRVSIPIELEGVYWFDLIFQDVLLTRMPLQVMYKRETQAVSSRNTNTEEGQLK